MGALKQLLPYGGTSLLQHSMQQAISAGFFSPVIVVVGSSADRIRSVIPTDHEVEVVENEQWETGMGSSIAAGMRALLNGRDVPFAVAILTADQPLIEARHLAAMRDLAMRSDAEAVAAEYADTVGVPAVFKRGLYDALLSLPPAAGARQLLRGAGMEVCRFPLPEAAIDIDTREDFESLTSGVRSRRT
jgi:molybdenum cofactor cytidylyltransferase